MFLNLFEGEAADVRQAVTGRETAPPPIRLEATPMAVRAALAELLHSLSTLDLEAEELGSVELVLAEVLNNIVEHAYGGHGCGQIAIHWTFGDTGLCFRIEDTGAPMPDGRAPLRARRRAADHAALIPEGGFGWFLISGLAHDVSYDREQGCNVLGFRMAVGG